MAVKKTSAEKKHAQSEVRRLRNKAVKSQVHTSARKYLDAVQKKDKDLALETLKALHSELDNAGRKGVMKANAVSRKKSRMSRLYNVTFTVPAAAAN
ncbi:30S ribosomal protein S20 [uncultured Treponema sp.]|uniref:30S ribosomal protein S20 n=1 Tax=uncultured Treponema sp. TaxID=162155 RepID=UPI00259541B9|nr:30S ribosomal protein S20 [uncultured Treponema sp.]